MKNFVVMILATGFLSSAWAGNDFICGSQDLVARLQISEPRIKDVSYNECNGGVGDDMTDCHLRNYQILVQDAALSFDINGDTLNSQMELTTDSRNTLYGSDVLKYNNKAIRVIVTGQNTNPILKLNSTTLSCTYGFSNIHGKVITMKQPVYKIFRAHEWSEFQSQGTFRGTKDDLRDGFIHLSSADQLERVIGKYYVNVRPLYVVKFANADFLSRLEWETASNGDLYPHLYNAVLSLDEVASFEVIE